ncbi:hypothetical protein CsSME_00036407 [Camellia sinensis var. sinensis]
MEEEEKKKEVAAEEEEAEYQRRRQHQPPNISPMVATTKGAYGGGMYGTYEGQPEKPRKAATSDTLSADGRVEPVAEPKNKPPPSTGDRDVDITGQSYIQCLTHCFVLFCFFLLVIPLSCFPVCFVVCSSSFYI